MGLYAVCEEKLDNQDRALGPSPLKKYLHNLALFVCLLIIQGVQWCGDGEGKETSAVLIVS